MNIINASAMISVLLLCSSCKSEHEKQNNDGTRYFQFSPDMEVNSGFNKEKYIAIRNNDFSAMNLGLGRFNAYSVKDNKFSHIRFAVSTRFHDCDRFKVASDIFEKTSLEKPDMKYKYGSLYDPLDSEFSLSGENLFPIARSNIYNPLDTEKEISRCRSDFNKYLKLSASETYGLKPFFVKWIYLEENADSDYINDVFLEKITYIGFHKVSFNDEFLRHSIESMNAF